MSIADTLLPEFDQEMATTRRLLERVPTDKGKWKPHPKSFSLGHLT
jgi:DNA topoisomerase VI subunit B